VTPVDVVTLLSALVLSTGLLVAVVAAVWWFDRYDREPLHLVVGVFLWGALAAPVLSAGSCSVLGIVVNATPTALAGWIGPTVEELMKAVGLLLVILLSREFDNPTDGVVYGTAVGLGFGATENLVYAAVGAYHAPVGETIALVSIRTAMCAGIHALSSAALGGCLGFATLSRDRKRRVSWAVGGFAIAVGLHAAWNVMLLRVGPSTAPWVHEMWFVTLPVLYALYATTLALFLRSEQRILRELLREEVELEVLPPWVADVIPYYRRRIRSDWWPSRQERTVLARLITRLAFRKYAVRRLPRPEADLAGLEVIRLRQRIRGMLAASEDCQSFVESDLAVPKTATDRPTMKA
jgi:RsiW-degrading membrane proteinase PrsW (M82 family)